MTIFVKVSTRSKVESIEKSDSTHYVVRFLANREKGEANKKLLSLLKSYFRVNASQIKIIAGFTSTRKIVEVH